MRRRDFITVLGGAAATWPLAARAQQNNAVKRLGLLIGGIQADAAGVNGQLLDELAKFGWRERQNLLVDFRLVGSNSPALISPHAEALVRAAPDVIYAWPATAVQVLQRLTSTIPIVFNQNGDPVAAGTVASLRHPGGNITGFLQSEPSINTKYVQLLKDIAPQLARVALLQTEATRSARGGSDFALVEEAAKSFSVTAVSLVVRDDPADIEAAIAGFAREPNGGLIPPPDNALTSRRASIIALAAQHRLPAVYPSRLYVDAGGLMFYQAGPLDFHRVAGYLDRILKGDKPGELPVVTPDKFEFVINLKAATALGLTIPPSLFALADEVIEP
jgi:putative ABC transport system substrate-binding protein